MKKILFTLMALLMVLSMSAQRRVNAYCLLSQKQVSLQINYDQVRYDKRARITERDFADLLAANQTVWNQAFLSKLNEELDDAPFRAVLDTPMDFKLIVVADYLTDYGVLSAQVSIVDADDIERASFKVYSRPGIHGGFIELMKESMERLGEETGEVLSRSI